MPQQLQTTYKLETTYDVQRLVVEALEEGIRTARSSASSLAPNSQQLQVANVNAEPEEPVAEVELANEGYVGEDVEPGTAIPRMLPTTRMVIYDSIATQLTEIFGRIIANVKHKRNALAPIEALTDDLLSRIFLFAVTGDDTHDKLELAHVCARWRSLILDDARLWTDVNLCDNMHYVHEGMERAQDALLDIRYQWSFEKPFRGEELLVVLGERTKQIRSLSVILPTTELNTVGQTLLSTPLPSARFVVLTTVPHGWEDEVDTTDPSVEELFGNNAPDLRYLHLQRTGLPWTISRFKKLTTLMLDKCHFSNPTPNADFITILEMIPHLRQLQLSECRSLCRPGQSFSDRSVSLPNLEIAQLEGLHPRDVTQILSVLETPPTLRLVVGKLRFRDDEAVTFSHLNLFGITSLDTICDLEVNIQRNNLFNIESVSFIGSTVKSGSNKNISFSASGSITRAFPSVLNPFRFTRLRRLSLRWTQCGWGTPILIGDGPEVVHQAPPDEDVLLYFLLRCPDIVNLRLSGARSDVLDALHGGAEGASTAPPCTKLHYLSFDRSTLTDDGLRDLVLRRPGCVSLRSLTLSSSSGFEKETVVWLRDRIEDICWDSEGDSLLRFDPPTP